LSVATVLVYLKGVKLGTVVTSEVDWILHSTSCWQSAVVDVTVCVTLVPFVVFLMKMVAAVLEEVVTVTVSESPALIWGADMAVEGPGAK
jgi:hypothetical protein